MYLNKQLISDNRQHLKKVLLIKNSINLQDDIDQKKVVKNVKPDSLHGKGGYKRYNKTSNFLNYQVKTHRFDFSPFSEPSAVGASV